MRGASALAATLGISPLIIGLTVVAFGTSSPELAVSVQSVFSGNADIAVGNVMGSNIANVLLILGMSAMICPLVVVSQLIRLDVPFMVTVSFAMFLLALDGTLDRLDGAILFAALVAYTLWLVRVSQQESDDVKQEFAEQLAAPGRPRVPVNLGLVVLGLVLLGFGANWLVDGAIQIARWLGVSDLIIGLTIVAIGTSLPEIVTSITASLRGQRDIAVGNVVGSNIFNILCVLGISSLVAPSGIGVSDAALRFDIPIMLAVSLACLPIFFTGNMIARWEGFLFFGYYVAYLTYLVLAASQTPITRTFVMIMTGFVIPLTVITILVCFIRAVRTACSERPTANH